MPAPGLGSGPEARTPWAAEGGGCGHGLRVGVGESGFRARCLCLTLEVRLCKQLTFGEAARSKYRNCTIFETSL